ncbi:Protein kinase domain [Phytophthora infestans]|uniref:Protein kinase domain n=1 Tax=Phytophthora infestans TaxID=4787 RepID=A0A8S9TYN2_PHYIN|nr:Protein kinase domain [Phytophthora infestans]
MGSAATLRYVERFLAHNVGNETIIGDRESLKNAGQHMRVTMVFILAGFMTIWLLCVGLIWHIRMNRAGAFKGNVEAARKVILPAYEPVLFVMAIINGAYIVFLVVAFATDYFDVFISPVILESFCSGNQFMFVTVLVLMFEKSLSFPAVKRAVGLSLILSYYTTLYVWVVTNFGPPNHQKEFTIGLQFVRGLLMLPFLYAFIKPPNRATKRIIRELCFATFVFYTLMVLVVIFATNPKTARNSHYVLFAILSWVAFCPLVVWRVLKADTEYWRGVGQRACALQDYFQRENGLSERISSNGIHVLIEMNRKCVIDFAYLELVRQIGVGSKSAVFQGMLKMKTHVAVKAYAPSSCSDDVVAAFSHEAAMCSVLNHPNIVKFHGMCVAPPTICLVFQLCQGNLADTLADQARRQNANPARQQLLINIGMMLDAARAVSYLHSFWPPLVHCDIQPTSFLVDAACNVQLSDFGESRSVNRKKRTVASKAKVPILENKQFEHKLVVDSPMGTTDSTADSPWRMHMEKNSAAYTAPEIIEQGELSVHGEAADVYSLAVTMWDILHPGGDKYPRANEDHVQVIEEVLHGARPRLSTNTPPRLRGIIERSWHGDPRLRPSATQIVAALEEIQEELCSRLVLDIVSGLSEFFDVMNESTCSSRLPGVHHTLAFPGAFIVDRMIDQRFVRCPAEGIRMGNALMDSSVLHHVNHSKSFENSATARYYFAFDASVESSSSSFSQNESQIPMLARGSNGGHPRTSFSFVRPRSEPDCQCRLLGQRLTKSSRFRKQSQPASERTVDTITPASLEMSHWDHYSELDTIPGTAATMA